ncbi:MAG: hypothetical protein ABI779_14840 [Acidobacteriota bacterium]
MKRIATATLAVSLLCFAACSSAVVNMAEPRRVVGTESSVRVDAEISDEVNPGAPVMIKYVVTNQRQEAIAIADILPETTFDRETRTVTVNIGAEVPGEVMLPRLVRIGPGETKTFSASARVISSIPVLSANPRAVNQTLLRLKLNFLGDTLPFAELIGIPERAIADKQRADALFGPWLERNEVLYTNAVPVQVTSVRKGNEADAERRIPTKAGRRGGI